MDVDHVRGVNEFLIGTFGDGAEQRKIAKLAQTRERRIVGPTVIGVAPLGHGADQGAPSHEGVVHIWEGAAS